LQWISRICAISRPNTWLDALGNVGVARAQLTPVESRKRVVRVVHRDRRNPIAAAVEKVDDDVVYFGGRTRVQERVAKPDQGLAVLLEQRFHDHFAFDHIVKELIHRRGVRAAVRVRVIADIKAGLQPLLDHRRTSVALTVHVQLLLVDEDRDGHLLGLERSDQSVGDALEAAKIRRLTDDRPVVDGDGHTSRRRLAMGQGREDQQGENGCNQRSRHRSAPGLTQETNDIAMGDTLDICIAVSTRLQQCRYSCQVGD
jgi:hypothetical protein